MSFSVLRKSDNSRITLVTMSDKDKNKDSEKEKPKLRVTADKEVASRCADINAPWVTRAGRQLQQASKPSKSVHYTPELNLDEALSKAD